MKEAVPSKKKRSKYREARQSREHAGHVPDDLNHVRSQTDHFANGAMGRFDYGYDEKNRHKYEQRDWDKADGWQYDRGDEITGYQRDGTLNGDGTVTVNWFGVNSGFEYDNNGNRLHVTGSNANDYTPNNLNQYTSDTNTGAMQYNDGKGNVRQTYGSPRLAQVLGCPGRRNRIARLMRQERIFARQRSKYRPRTTDSRHGGPIAIKARPFAARSCDT